MKSKVLDSLDLLELFGSELQPPHAKKVLGRLWELRITGTVAVRIFYFIDHDRIILLHAIKKQSDKLPLKEIMTARQRLAHYLADI